MASRRKINAGWLALQRERYGPAYRYIPPDDIREAGSYVPGVLKKMGMEAESRLSDITACWEEVAGKANADHSRPGRWERGVLTIYVDHHLWLAELQRFAACALEKRLREKFGARAVRKLRFEIDPEKD